MIKTKEKKQSGETKHICMHYDITCGDVTVKVNDKPFDVKTDTVSVEDTVSINIVSNSYSRISAIHILDSEDFSEILIRDVKNTVTEYGEYGPKESRQYTFKVPSGDYKQIFVFVIFTSNAMGLNNESMNASILYRILRAGAFTDYNVMVHGDNEKCKVHIIPNEVDDNWADAVNFIPFIPGDTVEVSVNLDPEYKLDYLIILSNGKQIYSYIDRIDNDNMYRTSFTMPHNDVHIYPIYHKAVKDGDNDEMHHVIINLMNYCDSTKGLSIVSDELIDVIRLSDVEYYNDHYDDKKFITCKSFYENQMVHLELQLKRKYAIGSIIAYNEETGEKVEFIVKKQNKNYPANKASYWFMMPNANVVIYVCIVDSVGINQPSQRRMAVINHLKEFHTKYEEMYLNKYNSIHINKNEKEEIAVSEVATNNEYVTSFEIPDQLAKKLSEDLAKQSIREKMLVEVILDPVKYETVEKMLIPITQEIDAMKNEITTKYVPDEYRSDEYQWNFDGYEISGNNVHIYKA